MSDKTVEINERDCGLLGTGAEIAVNRTAKSLRSTSAIRSDRLQLTGDLTGGLDPRLRTKRRRVGESY